MRENIKRGLFRTGLTALVIGLSSITSHQISNKETKQDYQITINRKKYFITQDKVILDEKENRVTDQRILGNVIEKYILSQN